MKRLHIHIAVKNLPKSVDFYTRLFGHLPEKRKEDYANWVLDDPGLHFAISARGHAAGINHLGIQAESPEGLLVLRTRADFASDNDTTDHGESACCHARSEKHWTLDPDGIAWEHFLTVADTEIFGDEIVAAKSACCIPLHRPVDVVASAPCCVLDADVAAGSRREVQSPGCCAI